MKKRILTVLIAILTVIPLVLVVPKAASYSTHSNTTVTSYGQYYYSSGYNEELVSYAFGVEISFPISNSSYFSFTYEFKDTYNGYVNLSITAPTAFAWNTTYFFCDGCTFTQSPNMTNVGRTKTFQLQFRDSKKIEFTVIHDTASTTTADTTFYNYTSSAYTSCSITSSSFVLQPDTPDIVDHIDNQLDIYLPGMNTTLSNIASNTNTMSTDIATIKGYLDGLEGYTDNIEPLLNQLINIGKINSYPLYQSNILLWANSYSTLSFDLPLPYFYYDHTTNTSDWTASHRMSVPSGGTTSLIFYTSSNIQPSNVSMYYPSNYPSVTIQRTGSTVVGGYPYYLVRLDITNTSSSSSTFVELEFNKSFTCYPIFYGSSSLIPDEVMYLFGTDFDNTYTRLLQLIANGVNGTYDTSQYDQYEQTMDGLNDSLRDRFNNVDDNMQTNIDTLFTPSGTAGSDGSIFEKFNFNGVNSLFTGVLNGIFTSFPAFKYILLFALLLLVIGVMI